MVLDRLIGAQNAWLADHTRRRRSADADGAVGMTTLTALVLRGQAWTLAHVGESRAWLCARPGRGRGGDARPECVQLTSDHAFEHQHEASRLTRASASTTRCASTTSRATCMRATSSC